MKKSLYRILFTVVLTLIVCITTVAQGPYRTRTYGFDWRNLQVFVEDNPLAPPVITMGEANRIIISLDLLAEDVTYLDFTIVH